MVRESCPSVFAWPCGICDPASPDSDILLACLVSGVTAIAAIGSLSEAVRRGLDREGQPLLGGDIEIAVVQRELPESDRRSLERFGLLSEVQALRAMAGNAERHTLVEIKAVDRNYPLYGRVELAGGEPLAQALSFRNGRHGIAADPLLLTRLGLAPGDALTIGEASSKCAPPFPRSLTGLPMALPWGLAC